MSDEAKFESFDKNKFMLNFAGLEDIAKETITCFLDLLPNLVADIDKAIKSKNSKNFEIAAHTAKGAISNFYAENARLLAFELERKGRDNNFNDVDAIFNNLKQQLSHLDKELRIFLNTLG